MSWYLALNPVQATALAIAATIAVLLVVFVFCALIVSRDADEDYRRSEIVREINRNKTHGPTGAK